MMTSQKKKILILDGGATHAMTIDESLKKMDVMLPFYATTNLATIGCGGADMIKESNCRYAVESGDDKAMTKIIKEMVICNQDCFENLDNNGCHYYERHFRLKDCIDIIKEKQIVMPRLIYRNI